MKLKVLGRYTNEPRRIDVYPGDEIEVDNGLGQFLLRDAPGTFEDPSAKPEQQPKTSAAARKEAGAILDDAHKLLDEAQQAAARRRAEVARDPDDTKPFDHSPDGTTVKTDTAPSVVTGPDSGVVVTHRADAAEQEETEEERLKALEGPPKDKQVTRAPKQK